MAQKEKIFVDGMFVNERREGTPAWKIASISIKVSQLVPFLQQHEKNSGYVNIDLKESANRKMYFELDTWVPTHDNVKEEESNQEKLNNIHTPPVEGMEYPEEEINPDDIPF